jgi:cell division protein FtsA
VFDLPVRRGLPETVGGLAEVVKSPIYSTGVGLALCGARSRPPGGDSGHYGAGLGALARAARRLADWFGGIF